MVAPVEPEKFTSSNEKIVGLFTLPDPVFFYHRTFTVFSIEPLDTVLQSWLERLRHDHTSIFIFNFLLERDL
jgi:hypothetical protein